MQPVHQDHRMAARTWTNRERGFVHIEEDHERVPTLHLLPLLQTRRGNCITKTYILVKLCQQPCHACLQGVAVIVEIHFACESLFRKYIIEV